MSNKLIINADDYGMSESINQAIEFCLVNEVIDRATLMVNMPYSESAVKKISELNLNKKIGLHLNLTEGTPLTCGILNTEFCENGVFSGKVFETHPFSKFVLKKRVKLAIEEELRAQIEKYMNYNISQEIHVDSHQHVHIKWSLLRVLLPLLREYNIKSIRLGINIPNNINVIKKIYRALVNKMIHKYDCSGIVDAGGIAALNNLLEINDGKIYKMTETWIHPDMLDGRLIDRFYPDNIIEFKRRWKL